MKSAQETMPPVGTAVWVKVGGAPVTATYHSWSTRYHMPMVVREGRVIPRRLLLDHGQLLPVAAPVVESVEPTPAPDDSAGPGNKWTYSVQRGEYMHCYVEGTLRSKFKVRDL